MENTELKTNEVMRDAIDDEANKPLTKKEKRRDKIKRRLLKEEDIKYQGPLSYCALRIIAWFTIALGQIAFLNALGQHLFSWNPLGDTLQGLFSIIASLSTPLFIVASFGLVLNRKRPYWVFIATYGMAFLGIGLGVSFVYFRYINGLFIKIGLDQTFLLGLVTNLIQEKIQVNVFADLFAFSLFNFFVNYSPKKVFVNKKLIIFRLFAILPIAFILASYVIKILSGTAGLNLSFYFYPFLATRSPVIFLIFVIASLWTKNRERIFLRLGASKEEYQRFLLTNRNSLSFSISLSLIILISVVLDIILFIVLFFVYAIAENMPTDLFIDTISLYEVGQSITLLLAIPILFLYSYTRTHKNSIFDVVIPIAGVGLCALVYIEGLYQFIVKLIG